MKRKEIQALQALHDRDGIKITGVKKSSVHCRVYIEQAGVQCFIVRPTSSSDYRGILNAACDARRAIRERMPA